MDATITLPWWSLVAILLFLLLLRWAQRQQRIRRNLGRLAGRIAVWRDVCENRSGALSRKASVELERYFTHLAGLRLKLGLVDYEQLVMRQNSEIDMLCAEARSLIVRMVEELEASDIEVPEAPRWVAAVQAVAELPAEHQRDATAEILGQVLQTAQHQHDEAMREYRWATAVRHRTLAAMRSMWQRLQRHLRAVERRQVDLDRHSVALNSAAAHYAKLRDGSVRRRVAGVVLRFAVAALLSAAGLTLTIWTGELFHIELLLSGLDVAESRALIGVYTVVLIVLGAVACCALRWSTLLPAIAALDIKPRRYTLGASLAALMLVGAAGTSGVAERTAESLLAVDWPWFTVGVLGALLYAAPILIALQAIVLEQLLRTGRPLAVIAAQRVMLAATAVLGWLAHALRARDW